MDLKRAAIALVAAIVTTACQARVAVWTTSAVSPRPEPPAAARFVAAYGTGDELAAERIASPLYGDEWARRGLSAAGRAAVRTRSDASSGHPTPLTFQYVDGAPAPDGESHLLYLVRPTGQWVRPTVWRVDTDAQGQVVWAELVWLFAPETIDVEPVSDPAALARLTLPPEVARLHPRLAFGLHAVSGSESYYALRIDAPAGADDILFIAVDESGDVRPGAWSYQRADVAMRPPGARA